MSRPLRIRPARHLAPLAALLFLGAAPMFSSGFQIMTQGARAMGMGLAFSGVASDPSAIFYNPAGLGWQKHFEGQIGASALWRTEGEFDGSNPFPGAGYHAEYEDETFLLPTLYAVLPMTESVNIGFGSFAQYGLGVGWDDADNFAGRFLAQSADLQSIDLNPVVSWQISPQFAVAGGFSYRMAKLELKQSQAAINPFTQSAVDIAHVELESGDLFDNGGWGWNAGAMIKPLPYLSLGVAYRSSITVDFDGEATFDQVLSGNPVFDAIVAGQLPPSPQPLTTSIEFPASWNIGAAIALGEALTLALEADWTEWSSFQSLNVLFSDEPDLSFERITAWEDSWAYRAGLEWRHGAIAVRAGYYQDQTPQPIADASPLLADNDRDAYTIGFGYHTPKWGVDIGDVYIVFDDIDTRGVTSNDGPGDNFEGVYKETANVFGLNFRFSW
ncbi:MAG TPA: outer membrane protein transport protein [Thermoanaerobaculia bacterium]